MGFTAARRNAREDEDAAEEPTAVLGTAPAGANRGARDEDGGGGGAKASMVVAVVVAVAAGGVVDMALAVEPAGETGIRRAMIVLILTYIERALVGGAGRGRIKRNRCFRAIMRTELHSKYDKPLGHASPRRPRQLG